MIQFNFRRMLGNQLGRYSLDRTLTEQNYLTFLAPKIPRFCDTSRFITGRIEKTRLFKAEGHQAINCMGTTS
jgi:hypothetical protein